MKPLSRILPCLLLLLLGLPARAEDPPEEDSVVGARAAYAELQDTRAKAQEARNAAFEKARNATEEEAKKAATDEAMKISREWSEKENAATDAFVQVFVRADVEAFKLPDEAELLETGLYESARDALEADPKLAVARWELLLKKLPKCGMADYVRHTWLPIGLPSTGDLEHAEKRLGELVAEVPEEHQPSLRMAVGDVQALRGNYEAAQASYAEALKAIPEDADPRKDARGRARGYIQMRAALVGKQAPEVDAKTWLGAEPAKLSTFKGKVVLLDCWATW